MRKRPIRSGLGSPAPQAGPSAARYRSRSHVSVRVPAQGPPAGDEGYRPHGAPFEPGPFGDVPTRTNEFGAVEGRHENVADDEVRGDPRQQIERLVAERVGREAVPHLGTDLRRDGLDVVAVVAVLGRLLAAEGIIESDFIWGWYLRVNGGGPFQAGLYELAENSAIGTMATIASTSAVRQRRRAPAA